MKRDAMQRAGVIAVASLMVSCLGGGGDGLPAVTATCESITGGDSTVTAEWDPTCLFCGVDGEENAADGNLDSFATVDAPNATAGQGASITATMQDGIVFPQGSRAGVFYKPPNNSGFNESELAITLTTYLDGVQQENPAAASNAYQSLDGDETGIGLAYKSFVTTTPFDAVRVTISDTQGATGPFQVHEICSNGGVG